MKKISFRKVVSLTSLTSFCLLAITGTILYMVPQGRVAYWVNWNLCGLSKEEWSNIHINLSLLFLICSAFHIYYNWGAIVSYLKNKVKRVVIFNREFNIAFVVALVFVVGTYLEIQPLKFVLDINNKIKKHHARVYGSPPYGHAELSSLENFCNMAGLNLEDSIENLKTKNIKDVDKGKTLKEIGKSNCISPQQVYILIKDVKTLRDAKDIQNHARE